MTWEPVSVTTSSHGTILSNPDGTTRSLNPDNGANGGPYHWETRPPNTFGPFELVTIENGRVAYNPMAFYGGPGEAVVFGFMEKAPNGSLSWITYAPLTV